MTKKIVNILIVGLVFFSFLSGFTRYALGDVNTSSNNDPNRSVNTDMVYAIQNGAYFMWNNTLSLDLQGTTGDGTPDGISTGGGSDSSFNYNMDRISTLTLNNRSAEVYVESLDNQTDSPTIPMNLNEWSSVSTEAKSTNNTLAGIFNSATYFPQDVYVDDIMHNDSSLYNVLIPVFMNGIGSGGDLDLFSLIIFIVSMEQNLSLGGNATVYTFENRTNADIINRFEGIYNITFIADALLNQVGDLSGLYFDGNATMSIHAKMNCYHVLSDIIISADIHANIINVTNPLNFINLNITETLDHELIYTTLTDCALGYELFGDNQVSDYISINWWWLLIAIGSSIIVMGIIGIWIQRSNCKSFKEPLDHLACRIGNEYRGNEYLSQHPPFK